MPGNPKMRMASEAVIDVLARLRAFHSLPWKCLSSMEGGRGLAAVATVVGAVGTVVFVKGMSAGWNRDDERQELLTVPGLQNSGSNCFLNVILQALASSNRFFTYLRAYELLGDEALEQTPVMPLSGALSKLLEELSKVAPGVRVINPRKIIHLLGCYARGFDLAKQQDASEALFYLAKALHQERMEEFEDYRKLAQSLAYPPLPAQTGNMSMELGFWIEQLRWPMEGTYASLLNCKECGFQAATQFQCFREIPLAPPCSQDCYIVDGCTIEDCLDQFTSPEQVSDFKCNRCFHVSLPEKELCNYYDDCSCEAMFKQQDGRFCVRGDAYKCLQIGRCPAVLCLQVQRVMINSVGQPEKVSGHVSFPTVLDIYPYTLAARRKQFVEPRSIPAAVLKVLDNLGHDLDGVGPQNDSGIAVIPSNGLHFRDTYQMQKRLSARTGLPGPEEDGSKRQLYHLISVVVHHGSPMAGHYTVYRKAIVPRHQQEEHQFDGTTNEEAIWFEISDASVVKVSEGKVLGADASLLFYEML